MFFVVGCCRVLLLILFAKMLVATKEYFALIDNKRQDPIRMPPSSSS